MSVRFQTARVERMACKHSHTVTCGNRLRVGARSKNSGLSKESGFLVKVLEIAVGAASAPTWFSLARVSIRDLVVDRNPSLPRNSGGGGICAKRAPFVKLACLQQNGALFGPKKGHFRRFRTDID